MLEQSKRVIFLMEKSSIVISGLEKRLKADNYTTYSISGNFDRLENYIKNAGVFIIYNPQDILYAKYGHKNMAHIKDLIVDSNGFIIFIGDAGDKEVLVNEFPEFASYKWLIRPVEPEAFCNVVDEVMENYEKIQMRKKAAEESGGPNPDEAALSNDEDADTRKRVLIVDDDPSYAMMVKTWIKRFYKTDVVTAGMQAITFLLKKPVDLILLDYEMPVVDGAQVLQMLRQEPTTKDIPVIFLTGVSTREGVERVMELKPAGYVLKSTTRENLLAIIDEKIGQ